MLPDRGKVLQPELLRSMLDAANDLIFAKDRDGHYLACNAASERLLGLSEAAQIGKTDRDFFPPEFAEAVRAVDGDIMASGKERRVEEWVTYPDGTKVLLESVKTPFYGPEGQIAGIVGVVRDITLRKQAEARLARALAFTEHLVTEAPIGIAVYDANTGRCLKVNRALGQVVGATAEQLLAQTFRELASWKQSGMLDAAEAALASSVTQQVTVELITSYGREVWVLAVFSRLRSEDGLELLLLLLKDITDSKLAEAEQRKLQNHVEQLQRIESLGQLAGGVAHEINNVIGSIMAMSDVLRLKGGEAAPAAELIFKSCCHGRDIVKALIEFSRKDPVVTALVDLNAVVQSQAKRLAVTTRENILIQEELKEDLPKIPADQAALSSAVMNLCLNAVDAMPEGGILTLRTMKTAHGMVQVCVEDTGQGMAVEVRGRAMDPFFSTKPFGKGAGLGLSVVFGVVQAHGGTIDIQSSPGAGTRVFLTFPSAPSAPSAVRSSIFPDKEKQGPEGPR